MKDRNQPGLFDQQDRMKKLNSLQDPLVSIGAAIDFEQFRPLLEKATLQVSYAKGGRPPYDRVMLFKALSLEKIYHLSDEQLEFQIKDRRSFMRFLGLRLSDKVPDAKTYWYIREALTKTGAIDMVFVLFRDHLRAHGYMLQEGKIVDASLVKAPIQRNSREENYRIKEGDVPEEWSDAKKSQKDTDATWTTKHGKHHFGYKNHNKVDSGSKLIDDFGVTTASEHDSQVLFVLIDETDEGQTVWVNTAYGSAEIRKGLRRYKMRCQIQKKGSRYVILTSRQKKANTNEAQTRCRVEHNFAGIHKRARGFGVRSIGIVRAGAEITLQNLVYNITRMIFLSDQKRIYV